MESRWRARAGRSSLLRGFLPAVRTEKWNEAARLEHDGTKGIMAALDQPQILIFYIAHGHNHSSVFGKLREKRRGHGWRRRSHENGVVRCEFRQTKRTVAVVHVNVPVAEACETLSGFGGKLRAELHGENVACQAGQHGRLVPKSRSDFEDPFVSLKMQRRGHGGLVWKVGKSFALPRLAAGRPRKRGGEIRQARIRVAGRAQGTLKRGCQ